jgi:hypothetical protein
VVLFNTYWQADALATALGTQRLAASINRQLLNTNVRLGYSQDRGEPLQAETPNTTQYEAELSRLLRVGKVPLDNSLLYRRTENTDDAGTASGAAAQELQHRVGLALGRYGVRNELTVPWQQQGLGSMRGALALTAPIWRGVGQLDVQYTPNNSGAFWQTAAAAARVNVTNDFYAEATLREDLSGQGGREVGTTLRYQLARATLGLKAQQVLAGNAKGASSFGFTLGTQLEPAAGGYRLANTRRRGVQVAQVRLYAFRDDNANGVADTGEPALPGVVFRNMNRSTALTTNAKGEVLFTDVAAGVPVRLEIDPDALPDIYLQPPTKPVVVLAQAGTMGEYSVPLQLLGEVAGVAYRAGRDGRRVPVANLALELADVNGRVVARSRSGGDGYYVLGGVKMGQYTLQLALGAQASGLRLTPKPVVLTPQRNIISDMAIIIE